MIIMAELDTVSVRNPSKDDFTVRFNGEPYTVLAGETKHYPLYLSFHIAKHLSDKLLQSELLKATKGKQDSQFSPHVSQVMIYDTPKRRIALYDILKSKQLVEDCVKAFNFKGFIGEMSEYDDYVAQSLPKATASKKPKGDEVIAEAVAE
jgi:hypothetical protein